MKKLMPLVLFGLLAINIGCSETDSPPVAPQDSSTMTNIPLDMNALLNDNVITEVTTVTELSAVHSWIVPPPGLIDTSFDVYAVTIIWGQYHNTEVTDAAATDWSGTLSTNAVGEVKLLHTISFDHGEDEMLAPPNMTTLAWKSFTSNDFDGITSLVFIKRGIVYIVNPTLKFETKPFTKEFDFHTLEKYTEFFPLDDRHGVVVVAHRLRRVICPSGMVSGEWIREENDMGSGHFSARWLDHHSQLIGIFTGTFWTNDDGQGEFEGYLSHHTLTVVLAHVKGRWIFDDPRLCPMCGSDHGTFAGRIEYLDGTGAVGKIIGEFGDYTLPLMSKVVPMKARWRIDCVDRPVDHQPVHD